MRKEEKNPRWGSFLEAHRTHFLIRSALMDMGAKNRHRFLFSRVTLRRKLHGSPAQTSMRPLPSGNGNWRLNSNYVVGKTKIKKRKMRSEKMGFRVLVRRHRHLTVSQSHDSNNRQPGTAQSRPNAHLPGLVHSRKRPRYSPSPPERQKDWTSQGNPRPSFCTVVLGALTFPPLLWCHPFRFSS